MINILISAIPLIVINYQFEVPKVFGFLILAIFLILNLISNFKKINFSKRDRYYLSWLITLLISGLLSNDTKTAILGGSYRHQGFIFFVGLYLLIKYIEVLDQKQRKTLYKYVAIVVLLQAILVILGLKIGTIGEINAVAGFLAMGIYFVKISFPKLFLTFPVVAMMATFSKSAILALVPYVFKRVKSFLLTIIVILVFVVKPINFDSLFESRGVIWKYGADIIFDNPIIGHGAESNETLYDQKFLQNDIVLTNLRIDRAHNLILDITIWSGLLGLYLFGMFLHESFKNVSFERREVLTSFLIYSMFQPLSVVHWILFALVV